MKRATEMKAPSFLAALCAGPVGVIAQTALQIADCDDLPSSIATDTTLRFTAQEVTDYLPLRVYQVPGIIT